MDSNKKYGIFVGRFQPPHVGHELCIREIINSGYKPVIVIGSINKKDERNPFSYETRRKWWKLILAGYGMEESKDYEIMGLCDFEDDNAWFNLLKWGLEHHQIYDYKFFLHCKPQEDTMLALCSRYGRHGETYEFVTSAGRSGIPVCATYIRNWPNLYRAHVNPIVYQEMVSLLAK